jgi:glutamate dehydrogenase (NAD(P)+)
MHPLSFTFSRGALVSDIKLDATKDTPVTSLDARLTNARVEDWIPLKGSDGKAAVEGVIHAQNAHRVQARLVVEGANGPTTAEADIILAQRGVTVVPDILANAGGVLVSYFEWVQANQSYWWTEDEVEDRLRARMTAAWTHVAQHAETHGITLRAAATSLAVQRVAEAHRVRGLYP